jgi:hypothetical protein
LAHVNFLSTQLFHSRETRPQLSFSKGNKNGATQQLHTADGKNLDGLLFSIYKLSFRGTR